MLAKLNCKSLGFSLASDTHGVFFKLFSSSSVVLSLASPTGNTDIQMVSQQEVLSVNNLHSITPTKSKIIYLGLGRQSQMVYSCRKPTEPQAALFLSSKKHLWLGRMSLAYPSYIPVNKLVMLTSINLLNLLHIPKYKIAVTVQEKVHYVIGIWNQRIWSHFVQTDWINLTKCTAKKTILDQHFLWYMLAGEVVMVWSSTQKRTGNS